MLVRITHPHGALIGDKWYFSGSVVDLEEKLAADFVKAGHGMPDDGPATEAPGPVAEPEVEAPAPEASAAEDPAGEQEGQAKKSARARRGLEER